jgi:O-glycosyl hydrolase
MMKTRAPKSRMAIATLALIAGTPIAWAQNAFTIDTTQQHQVMDGFGFAATGTWRAGVATQFQSPTFAAMLVNDLKAEIVRLELPPSFESTEDLDPNTLDWSKFNLNSMEPAATLVRNMHLLNPNLKVFTTIWSPPAWMKDNASTEGGKLRTDRYPHFAKFCAAACLGFPALTGVPLYAFSIENEPRFDNPFNSCVYEPTDYRDTVLALDAAWTKFGVTTGLLGAENHAAVASWVIDYSTALVNNPAAMSRMLVQGIHGYATNGPDVSSLVGWQNLAAQYANFHFPHTWMTEASGQDPTWLGSTGVNAGTSSGGAMSMARDMHHAIVGGQVQSWVHWTVTTDDPSDANYSLLLLSTPNPKYHAFRHFSRFVRPGAVRVEVSPADDTLLISSFMDQSQHAIVTNVINMGSAARTFTLQIARPAGWPIQRVEQIRSSSTESSVTLADAPVSNDVISITTPGYSLTTLRALAPTCYANCDGSTGSPTLGASDFVCFLNHFRAGDSYANCDGSTSAPVLGAADFVCFLNQFRAGCQ